MIFLLALCGKTTHDGGYGSRSPWCEDYSMTGILLIICLVWHKVVLLSTVQLLSIVNDQATREGTYNMCQEVQLLTVQISQTLI
jgi:hypothetical protein